METNSVENILTELKSGRMGLKRAARLLKVNSIAVLEDVARQDLGRFARRGVPEIIYSKSKSNSQLRTILHGLLLSRFQERPTLGKKIAQGNRNGVGSQLPIIFSKIASESQVRTLKDTVRSFNLKQSTHFKLRFFRESNIAIVNSSKAELLPAKPCSGRVAIISAGTSDIPALSEAEIILRVLGCEVLKFNDIGVAALHRLVAPMKSIAHFNPDAIIVAAGMEGALPSVIAGLSSVPVIGLPTSVGFGFGGRGESALMSMLQACPLGIAVVNIDGGVAAGVYAHLIAKRAADARLITSKKKT